MSTVPGSLQVAMMESAVCFKIAGRANFTLSVDFKTVVNELWGRGLQRFVMDVTDCVIMDSTFVGVLAGLSLKMADAAGQTGGAQIELLNANQRVEDLLDNLGIAHLFAFKKGEGLALTYSDAAVASASREEISRTSLEAHCTLMNLNPNNVPKFKDVAKFLAEDLKKLQEEQGEKGTTGA